MNATADTQAIEALLASRIGLDPASIGRDQIRRAVRHRMAEVGCHAIADYVDLLGKGEEWDELVARAPLLQDFQNRSSATRHAAG